MEKRFIGRAALVTGCGSEAGIGYAAAARLAREGARVFITSTTDRIHDRRATLAELGADIRAWPADLTDFEQAKELVRRAVSVFGQLDVLVNNAGMAQVGNPEPFTFLADMDPAEWHTSMERNLTTCFNVTRAALPHLIERKYGRIVNVSSVTGPLVSNPGESAYSAAKSAMVGLSRGLALETAQHGITVNCVAPGWIATGSSTGEEQIAAEHTPISRAGTPEEVADLIAYLATEGASYITGQMVVIDGGNTIQDYKGPKRDYY